MHTDSSDVPSSPEGAWSDADNVTTLDPPRLPSQPPSGQGQQYSSADLHPESPGSSSSSVPSCPEGEWSDGNGATASDPLDPILPPPLLLYSGAGQQHSSACSQQNVHRSSSSSVPSEPAGEWSGADSGNVSEAQRLFLLPHSGIGQQESLSRSRSRSSSSVPSSLEGQWSAENVPARNPDLESSPSNVGDSQSSYEEPATYLASVNISNSDASTENQGDDDDQRECLERDREIHFGNPTFWANAYEEIQSLRPDHIVKPSILDFCISSGVLGTQDGTEAYYLDRVMMEDIAKNRTISEKVRGLIAPGTTGTLPMRPILFLHTPNYQHSHYLIFLNFTFAQILVLDLETSETQHATYASWDRWRGLKVWKTLADAFEWPDHNNTPVVREIDWVKFGTDNGPDIVSAAIHFKLRGWPLGNLDKPDFSSANKIRMDIFETVLKRSFDGFKAWKRHHQRERYESYPSQPVLDEMQAGPFAFHSIVTLAMVLQHNSVSIPVRKFKNNALGNHRRNPLTRDPSVEGEGQEEEIEASTYNIEDPTFDQYYAAPPRQLRKPSTVGTYTFIGDGILQSEKSWSLWIDRGLRIIPSFYVAFSREDPAAYRSTQTPGATSSSSPTLKSSPWTHSSDSLPEATMGPQLDVEHSTFQDAGTGIGDSVHLGLRGMLDEAGREAGTVHSQNAFLTGTTRSGDHIKVSPQKDSIVVDPSSIVRKADIDSLIWVGRHVQFKDACNIYLMPVHRHSPPFSKSNHVSVRLLLPPTQAQWDNHQIGNEIKYFQLSQIPHMDFGHIGDGDARFNVVVCFPRMTFKPAGSRFMKTFIPHVIQEVWLTHCVIAALQDTFKADYPGTMEYIPSSVEEQKLKYGGDRKTRTFPLSPAALSSLQQRLGEKVNANPSLLSRFGSFFFVIDSRGFKLLSKQHKWSGEATREFQDMLPFLDLQYMMDRDNGELFLDMGISYHAEQPEVEPVVGLWKLPDLKEIYQRMGFRKPIQHHTNTLLSLGGMQAQTTKSHRHAKHILSRLSYNLVFQVVRSPGTKEYLTSVDDAIKGNNKFVEGCDKWIQLFSKSFQQGYGVRDEVRGGGKAIFNMLDALGDKATHDRLLNAILWVPSQTFFQWVSRRLIELKNVQLKIAISKPPNLGLLSWLLVHLMQHVMTTPIPKKSFMTDVLMDVNFAGVIGHSGLFFLKELNLETLVVDGIEQLDPPQVVTLYKSLNAKPKRAVEKRMAPAENAVSNDFPWGRIMSWSMLKTLLDDHPTTLVRGWSWDPHWELDFQGNAAELFIAFTNDVWLSISESLVSQALLPQPHTLIEAMESWSVFSINTLLGDRNVQFIPSTHGLKGRLPTTLRQGPSFTQRRASFFPSKEQPLDDKSVWGVFSNTHGAYIHRYHNFLENNANEVVDECHKNLDTIFSHIQCLPSFQPKSKGGKLCGPIWVSANNKVVVITNSKYYRLERVQPVVGEIHKVKRIQTTMATLEARLNLQNHGIPIVQTLRNRKHLRREVRKLPNRKQRSDEGSAEETTFSDYNDNGSSSASGMGQIDSSS